MFALLLLAACSQAIDTRYVEGMGEIPGPDTGSLYQPGPGIDAWGPCEAEEGEPDPLGCCLDECAAVAALCWLCGEDPDVCAAAEESCTRRCASWCGAEGCDDFDPVGETSFADCAE